MKPKERIPLWLERELEDIDQMIGLLNACKSSVYSLSSSPVAILVRLLVDLLMRIKNSYENGVPETEHLNEAIVFLDFDPMGPLGNSNQRTIKFNRKLNWSVVYRDRTTSPMPRFLRACAVFFSRSLQEDFNFSESFHDFLKGLQKFLPPGLTGQQSKYAEKNQQDIKELERRKRVNAYYRRRRKRK
jgi:hypothetical protein